MNYSNFHTHCNFCDGKGEPEDYIKEAIKLGFRAIGFSSHAPLPMQEYWVMRNDELQNYCNTISELKIAYKGQIELYLGLEIDYNPEVIGDNYKRFMNMGLDYNIGAVHILADKDKKDYAYVDAGQKDFEKILYEFCGGDIKQLVKKYYSMIRNMVAEIKPDIVAHLDLLKKNNKNSQFFTEKENWYISEVIETLGVIKENNSIIEINTGGIARGYLSTIYPSPWILSEANKLEIPIMINADAHNVSDINCYFENSARIAKKCGYENQRVLMDGNWCSVKI